VANDTIPKHVQCPMCQSPDVRRSYPKGLIDRLMLWMGKTALRCRGCECRFYFKLTPDDRLGRPDLSEDKNPLL
jgi:hypothetical protein